MKASFSSARPITCALACLALAGSVHAADPDNEMLATTVRTLGRINGQALACSHKDLASRIKTIMINRVPKTMEFGVLFEQATTAAFLAQSSQNAGGTGCPPRAALTVELEIAARPLTPPSTHQIAASAELPDVGINPRYLLQAHNGKVILDGDFRDRFQLITFGYTFCPDICPTTLLEMSAIMKQLGEQSGRVQPLFFSVDPERDTLKHLGEYLGFFDARIIGATGSPELVKSAAKNFKVRYEKVIDPNGAPENYAIDHSAGMYLLAPGGQFLARFPYGTAVADIVSRLQSEMRAQPVQATGTPDKP